MGVRSSTRRLCGAALAAACVLVLSSPVAALAAAPPAPTNVRTAGITDSSIQLAWDASARATSYQVRRGTSSASTTATSYPFAKLAACTSYTLSVRARNKSGYSSWVSTTAKTTGCGPAKPVNVRTSNVTGNSIELDWDAAAGATSYDVHLEDYFSTSATTSFNFTQLTPCTTFTLGVRSRDASGTSAWSDVTQTTSCATPPSPTPDPAPSPGPTPPPPTTGAGLHVSGNQLQDASGKAVQLHGVNYSGTEYACIDGWGIFDGPSDDASITAMRSWSVNVVHMGLNEDCILGINGAPAAYSGANYMNAIAGYVNRLHAQGLYAEISLMWAAPGTQQARDHPPILNQDHSPAALKAIANAFKDDPKTFIGLQSEPHAISWACWRNGGSACSVGYAALGMQGALDAVRSTGATNVVTASGIDYANNLSQWPANKPTDPLGQLMAEAHVYGGNSCSNVLCFDANYAPVAAQVPLIFGETGETYDASSCGTSNIATFLNWADAHGVGYEPWTWDPWGNCSALISDYDGTPANAYASYVRSHLQSRP